jgi:8-oxo-dGTP diphosphatase
MLRAQKVVAYIVRDGRLLVFTHADDADIFEAGIQAPAGTVRDGEFPEDAVLREAFEETGLRSLRVQRYLGAAEWDARPHADAVHVRHFFQLALDGNDVPEQWFGGEDGDGRLKRRFGSRSAGSRCVRVTCLRPGRAPCSAESVSHTIRSRVAGEHVSQIPVRVRTTG